MLDKLKCMIGRSKDMPKSRYGAEVEFFKDSTDHWRWRVIASNGRGICIPGESFSSKAKAEKNFKRVAKFFQTGK